MTIAHAQTPAGAERGTRYGPMVVVVVLSYGRKARVRFRCDCGNTHDALLHSVKTQAKKGRLYGCKSCQAKAKSDSLVRRFDFTRYNGKRFGRLLVTGFEVDKSRRNCKSLLVCMCDCGAQTIVQPTNLTQGKTISCGCFHTERLREVGREVGLIHANTCDGELNGHTPLYRAWMKIKGCCKKGNEKEVHKVCHEYDDRWNDFRAFYADFGPIGRYQTISRVDAQKPWERSNCFVNLGRRHQFEKQAKEGVA